MKKKYIWLSELIVWLVILVLGFYFFIYNTTVKENAKNIYYMFIDDAAGLVKGSPVRIMGINIGYVRLVKIFDNKVFVSFLVTEDGVKIPQRATATIEFYGLGGSTSLELNPKTSITNDDKEVLLKGKSYRVQDFWNGNAQVSDVLINIYGSFGRMIKKTDLLNHKDWLKQNSLINSVINETDNINTAQTVIIYKMTEAELKRLKNNTFEIPQEINNPSEEVKNNE